jgi:transglutaminase-like putative cysteine protease
MLGGSLGRLLDASARRCDDQKQRESADPPLEAQDTVADFDGGSMTRIAVKSELRYEVQSPSGLLLALSAAETAHQHVYEQHFAIAPEIAHEHVRFDPSGHDLVRVSVEQGLTTISYKALVDVRPHIPDDVPRHEVPFIDLPGEVLVFLNPSRYCQSDVLERFAQQMFGSLAPGFDRVTGICNWIWDHLSYVPGSTDASSSAVDVLVGGAGVCRDYAHLGISFCRALGIPARYVSGYAVDLEPPDFHGFFEAFLDGAWYLFDATRMAPIDGLVRIAAGRDAADVAFAAVVGAAQLVEKEICVIDLDRAGPHDPRTNPALGTA